MRLLLAMTFVLGAAGAPSEIPVTKSDVDALEHPAVASDARIVPYYERGEAKGFKLFCIKPESFGARCGLKNGDVVEKVNEMDLSSPEKALTAYAALKQAKAFDVEILRDGKPLTLHYRVVP